METHTLIDSISTTASTGTVGNTLTITGHSYTMAGGVLIDPFSGMILFGLITLLFIIDLGLSLKYIDQELGLEVEEKA